MNTQIKILVYILLVGGMLYYIQYRYEIFDISLDKPITKEEGIDNSIMILNSEGKDIFIEIDLADTPQLRQQGLSNREELGDYQGMLFVFDSKGTYPFWMKDMYLSLDIIYIDENYYIVDILEDIMPCTDNECVSFTPSQAFKYVLEVNSGFANINRVNIGNAVIFDTPSLK